ncbi:hypothetical protein [Desulfosarcina ovata]|uniref:Uncharacterized protein n=1 Tax=Desulfosarcina ovata subsp. ovata TaxID=2752305 RepID=A0A5K8AMW4_9BACT|nr:hypothetical protein [Desulfosarcina ovata]BBO92964.1 hypothetical protein DSCOOX_61440 [Desulfosarcina ovata subsp. ovata]
MSNVLKHSSQKAGLLSKVAISFLLLGLLLASPLAGMALAQTRIVVLPFYTEEGQDARAGGAETRHYRRMMGFITNQLVRHGFEVISPFARDAQEREYNRVMERAREDSSLACMEMCKKYGTDAAYIVWLTVRLRPTSDRLWMASARVDGEGYDSGGRLLGANVSKTFKITKWYRDDAIAEVEKEVGDTVGRELTKWSGRRGHDTVRASSGSTGFDGPGSDGGGVLERNLSKTANLINVRLDGANEYELTEIFGKVINTATGVVEAKRYSTSIQPENPQASFAT